MFLDTGFENGVMIEKILAITNPESAPGKRMISRARDENKAIDHTMGRRRRALINLTDGYIVESALTVGTLKNRMMAVEK